MILLDALGTLVGLRPPWDELVHRLAQRGVEVEPAAAAAALRLEMAHYRRECARARDPASLAALREECAQLVTRELGVDVDVELLLGSLHFEPYPEVPAALRRLGAEHELAVVSNWDISLHEVLAQCGLDGFFTRVICSAELGAAKPDPAIFLAALAGAAAEDAIHVGDSLEEDVAGARACGIEPLLLLREDDCGLLAPGGSLAAPSGVRVIRGLDGLR